MSGPQTFSETYTPDRLIAGLTQIVTRPETLLSGQNLARGAVVGLITASGKITLSASAAGDGSQVPYGVLADDCNASGGDLANCPVILAGEVNDNALILGAGHTLASIRAGLRDRGIYLKTPVTA
ncbi:head decoration protein [Falsiroseomonas sp. CW058]|uniref:head decoration protein n=1 Tax=Falsiroseomonas sp. CW058 TaxID=3388664 RepID=UPI003D30F443